MFEKCNWTKYLINIPKHNYQSNKPCAVKFVLIFSFNRNIYILIVNRLFRIFYPAYVHAFEAFVSSIKTNSKKARDYEKLW